MFTNVEQYTDKTLSTAHREIYCCLVTLVVHDAIRTVCERSQDECETILATKRAENRGIYWHTWHLAYYVPELRNVHLKYDEAGRLFTC